MNPYGYLIQAGVGFAGVLAGCAVSWGYLKAKVDGLETFRQEHLEAHERIDRALSRHGQDIAVLRDRAGL